MSTIECLPAPTFDDFIHRIDVAITPSSEHTLLYMHIDGVDRSRARDVRAAIEHITAGLGGKVTLMEMDAGDHVLLLEKWPLERGVQVARLLRSAAQGSAFRHLGAAPTISIGVVPIRGCVNVGAILARGVRACDLAARQGQNNIAVYAGNDSEPD